MHRPIALSAPRAASIGVLALLSLHANAIAANRYVAPCGNDGWSGSVSNCLAGIGPKRTIQAAINSSNHGDTIFIMPGAYPEHIDLNGKAIALVGTGGAALTHLIGVGAGPIVTCNSLEGPGTLLEGLTIRDGFTTGSGAGLFCALASPTIVDCAFIANDAASGGGAVSLLQSSPSFSGCSFLDNRVHPVGIDGAGGAVLITFGTPSFTDCLFDGQSGARFGGAVAVTSSAAPSFVECVFTNNSTDTLMGDTRGGAVHLDDASAEFEFCHFESNASPDGGGAIFVDLSTVECLGCGFIANDAGGQSGGGIRAFESTVEITGCSFEANRAGFYGAAVTGVFSDLSIILSGFEGNGAVGGAGTDRGGAIWASYCDTSIGLSSFSGNASLDDGGAITVGGYSQGYDTLIQGCAFSNNHSVNEGGAISLTNGQGQILGCTFTNNESWFGGAVHINRWQNDPNAASAHATVDGCTFEQCSAFTGGGIEARSSTDLLNSEFYGNDASNVGGGVSVGFNAHHTIRNSLFEGNTASSGAAAIVSGSSCEVRGCTFRENAAENGGALIATVTGTAPRVVACSFLENSSLEGSGAIGIGSGAHLVLLNSVVAWNTADANAGAVRVYSGSIQIANCTIANNTGGGVVAGEFAFDCTIANSIVWGNISGPEVDGDELSVRYSNVQGGVPGIGNIQANPQFIGAFGQNYRLQPSSPCIDAGANWLLPVDSTDLDSDGLLSELVPVDFDGASRIADHLASPNSGCAVAAIVDIGPFEAPGVVSDNVLFGDIDGNGAVGSPDLALLLGAWAINAACHVADLNGDGTVDAADLALLLGGWGGGAANAREGASRS